eukprot:CAMPEP_0181492618 /NCGR_PEP_ID=MMETSP1110-20121109/50784_1 /TAXON_ID=174948 /ORGANISM="Symbiodinium sp., Strain CCMP421" /LENGTH=121 /DNA_ID=CAMNT_0023619875 /DNA_START=224 /DNA_END=586 /DNA_ORIENTATION=+
MIDARLVGTPLEDWPFRVPLHAVDWEALALDRGDEHPPLSVSVGGEHREQTGQALVGHEAVGCHTIMMQVRGMFSVVSQRKMFGGTCGPSNFDVFACCTSSSGSDMFSESKELVFKTELVP